MVMNDPAQPLRWRTVGVYLLLIAGSNSVWEVAQLPLYQIWLEGTFFEQSFALIHCSIGDILIAAVSLAAAFAITGRGWPYRRYWSTAFTAALLGIAYTVYSEWQNVSVRGSWAYRDIMPIVPPFGTGLAPLLQWVILPLAMFAIARRICRI